LFYSFEDYEDYDNDSESDYDLDLESYQPIKEISADHEFMLITKKMAKIDSQTLQSLHHGTTVVRVEEDSNRSCMCYLKLEIDNATLTWRKQSWSSLSASSSTYPDFALKGESDPEKKRKIIGNVFIDVFDQESSKIKNVIWLGQGTIYPDVIESISVKGPSATIKSHHNVGGLPDYMTLKVIEPLNSLFKDEVRRVGATLNIKSEILQRHPFPGPGLGIRILGDITKEKVRILQEVDYIFINGLKKAGLYNDVWQAGSMLLPIKSVGVMGDERTYERVVALRAVSSTDGMTADWCHLPFEFLSKISNEIINKVKGVNRVVYDISSKPPATIEWE